MGIARLLERVSDMDADRGKYAELKPKSSVSAQLAMSKVYISKSWDLPPRSRPGRRPRAVEAVKSRSSREQPVDDAEGSYDLEERKKRQNRDAQRAYRERRANKMLELEGVVETLQELVKSWQKKFKDVELELSESRKRVAAVERENEDLQRRLRQVTGPASRTGDSDVTLLDPLLQGLIDNFKPMKAVTLKKRKLVDGSPQVRFEVTPVSPSPGDCGFCSGGTTCVCKELDSAKVEERCTEDTSTCEKCSDIDASCIRPRAQTAVSRERCLSAPQSSGLSRLLSDSGVAVQTSVSLGDAQNLAAETSLSSGFCCSACGYKEKKSEEPDLKLLGLDQSEQPNTMDPNFVPGSCSKCQKDPQKKAFCQAIFGPPVSSSSGVKAGGCCGKGTCPRRAP